MKKVLLAVALLSACLSTLHAQKKSEDLDAKYGAELLKSGTQAPDFSLPDTDGQLVNLRHEYSDGYTVIDFWASWCGDCRREMPAVSKLSEQYFEDGVQFVGVSFDTDSAQWKKCVREKNKMIGKQVSELKKWKETQVSKDYHINWIPTLYLLNPDGTVNLGTVDVNKLSDRLSELKAAGKFEPYQLKMPEFPGGVPALMQFVKGHLRFPKTCEKLGAKARVVVSFVVERDGSVSDLAISNYTQIGSIKVKGPVTVDEIKEQETLCRTLFTQEALRVVRAMPCWKPGEKAGRKQRVKYNMPFKFAY